MSLSEQEIVVQPGLLKELARELCIKAGIPTDHAQLIADLQVETDLRGVHSHGTRALPRYLRSIFNGDLLLATRTPSGSMYVMLGDFTGHGLPAAIGAIPVAEVFYGMANKGFSIAAIVAETNRKLRAILPTEVFFSKTSDQA